MRLDTGPAQQAGEEGYGMHSSLISKIAKARIYAEERDRITIDSMACEVRGNNASHTLRLQDGAWTCDCHFFHEFGDCSHAMAMSRILNGMVQTPAAVPVPIAPTMIPNAVSA